MKSYVVGGAGFIGSNLVRKLLSKGHEVVVIDDLSSGRLEFIPKNVEFHHCDIVRQDRLLTTGLENANYVFFLAAQFANELSTKIPMSDASTGTLGFLNVLEILKRSSNLKKLVYTSSSCVYGNGSNPVMNEEDKLYPVETPYAIQKYVGELYSKFYSDYFKLPIISLRIFNTYGPFEVAGENRNVTAKFLDAALSGGDINITGTGNEQRDYTFVGDTAELLYLSALSAETTNGEVFNAGTGKVTSTIDLASKILEIASSKSKIKYLPLRDWDHVLYRCSNINKATNILNYNPNTGLEEGLKKTIEWYKDFLNKH
jgi:UDP-glucose 4-epimerase